ncbi:MAG: hypothetical protein ABI748_01615, partial [Dokdonella sp.]
MSAALTRGADVGLIQGRDVQTLQVDYRGAGLNHPQQTETSFPHCRSKSGEQLSRREVAAPEAGRH